MTMKSSQQRSTLLSLGIILVALGIAYAPLPTASQTVVIVSGTELEEPLKVLETKFEQENPSIHLELKFQGSQELANKFLDNKNDDFKPTILIPANGEILQELGDRLRNQGSEPFYEAPRPIAKTQLVAIAWASRGKVLFPDGRFNWNRLEKALQAGNWGAIGGATEWGSFDFVMTDPTRSNSGQLTLSLWAQAKLGSSSLNPASLNSPTLPPLLALIKRSVYQPSRSTDTLLQDFITRGTNDADVAVVYESIALYRWQQARVSQGTPYQIFYLNPTIETVSTAAIVRRDVEGSTADAAEKFLDFLTQPEQQAIFVQYGFRPILSSVDLKAIPNSPWKQSIPGAEMTPTGQITATPNTQTLNEIQRLWERAN
jgi:ABC-type molybdate transport system substrate-binding protein